MFVYELAEPLDVFDALTPLPDWIAADPRERARWALQAVLALADAAVQLRWDGDMRHLPSVGAVLVPPESIPYLVVKQDNNGTTFVISAIELPWHGDVVAQTAEVRSRRIGAWLHPTSHDIPDLTPPFGIPTVSTADDPPF
jgi:hypothetical protein